MLYRLFDTLGWPADPTERRRIVEPLATAIYTDTDGFRRKPKALTRSLYRQMVDRHLAGREAAILRAATAEQSAAAVGLLRPWPVFEGVLTTPTGAAIREEFLGLKRFPERLAVDVTSQTFLDRRLSVVSVPKDVFRLALAAARLEHPDTNADDVRGWILDDFERKQECACLSVLLVETDAGVLLSTRSIEPGPAFKLAQHLGGGGSQTKAGKNAPIDRPLAEVGEMVDAWLLGSYGPLLEEALSRSAGRT
jgi:hypothetical protein